jgi:hypothetical protein
MLLIDNSHAARIRDKDAQIVRLQAEVDAMLGYMSNDVSNDDTTVVEITSEEQAKLVTEELMKRLRKQQGLI